MSAVVPRLDLEAIGNHLRLTLARLLVNVWQSLEARQQAVKNAAQAMSAPFIPFNEGTQQ